MRPLVIGILPKYKDAQQKATSYKKTEIRKEVSGDTSMSYGVVAFRVC